MVTNWSLKRCRKFLWLELGHYSPAGFLQAFATKQRFRCHIFTDSIGTQLCERVLAVLFDVWIIACARCFPAPSLWKTLQEMCCTWRHHEALITHWHRVNVALTIRLLRNLYGTSLRLTVAPGMTSIVTGCQHL